MCAPAVEEISVLLPRSQTDTKDSIQLKMGNLALANLTMSDRTPSV